MDQTVALSCNNLNKHYGKHRVLRGIDLTVSQGSIHGLVGLNGAGKTTTLECMLGLRPKDEGEISILGFAPNRLHCAQGKIAVVFDSPCLHPQLTVRQCLQFASLQASPTALPIAEVERLLGIERYAHFKVKQLSLGNRRRTAIAQALINQPQFVILDEPFNGLDAGGVDDVLRLLKHLNHQQGTSFLLASHQLAYLETICTHVAILHNGKIHRSDTVDNLLAQEQITVNIVATDPTQARAFLSQIPEVTLLADEVGPAVIRCRLNNMSSAQLNKTLVKADIGVEQLMLHKPSLEAVFYHAVGEAAA